MKDINLRAAAMTLAAARAVRELKLKLRAEGARATDERMYGLRSRIGDHLARHPEIIERATRDIERWRSKFTTSAQKTRR